MEAKQQAHKDERVMDIWNGFQKIAENVPLSSLEESNQIFGNFTPLEFQVD